MNGTFPFGRAIETLVQVDRTPKRLFVIGAYASAVYARWQAEDGTTLVNALAVASEPEIFWRGEGAETIIEAIPVPQGAGSLTPAGDNMNGPSGIALDELFLAPLGFTRSNAWMCDVLPHSCKTSRQATALSRTYDRLAPKLGLPAYDWPLVPETLADDARRAEIADEIAQADPDIIITLGDSPLEWVTRRLGSKSRLVAYGESPEEYGRFHELRTGKRTRILLPLAHPRQVARLGSHSAKLAALHEQWMRDVAPWLLLGGAE